MAHVMITFPPCPLLQATSQVPTDVVAGANTFFRVQVADACGGNANFGGDGDKFEVVLQEQQTGSYTPCVGVASAGTNDLVTDEGQGIYKIDFSAQKATNYDVCVLFGKSARLRSGILNSPFTLQVLPGAPNAAQTTSLTPGPFSGTSGQQQTFRVQAKDQFGNNILRADPNVFSFEVGLVGPATVAG